MTIFLLILYIILLITFIISVPLRLKYRNKTLKEVDTLRKSFQMDLTALTEKIESRKLKLSRQQHSSINLDFTLNDVKKFNQCLQSLLHYTPWLSNIKEAAEVVPIRSIHKINTFCSGSRYGFWIFENIDDAWEQQTKEVARAFRELRPNDLVLR